MINRKKKRLKRILLMLLVVFIAIQFIQPARNRSEEVLNSDITKTCNIPENVQVILKYSCYDCHSNNTHYPWYSRMQPGAWFMARHIRKGKAEINFSEFGSYSQRRQISKLKGIENSVKEGTMPLWSYNLIHRNANLSEEQKALIVDWVTKIKDSLVSKD
jgi:hypothetical protein